MAQLKDSVVSGNLRVTDTTLTDALRVSIINVPTSSGGTTFGPGSNGQVLKSNGTTVYWGSDSNSVTGVKGNAESSYRTGNVNLTPANIGALALSGGTMTGDITFTGLGTPSSYPAKSKGIYWSGGTDSIEMYYNLRASDAGELIINMRDDTNVRTSFAYNGTVKSYIDTSGVYNGKATSANKLNTDAGGTYLPVYFSSGVPVAVTVKNNTSVGTIGWTSGAAGNAALVTVNSIAYWNGAYSGTTSNLAYCVKGTFGSIVTKNTDDYYSATATRTANTVLAAPNGSNGAATFRKLVAADIPDLSGTYLPLSGGTMTGDIEYPGPGGRKTIFGKSAFMYYVASTSSWAGGLNYYSSDGSTGLGAFGAYGTANTLSYHYIGGTYNAPQIKIEPTGPNLIINSEDASTPMITLFRKGNNKADWRIINNAGTLYFQSDYTDTVGSWYNVLNLSFNSGDIAMKSGALFTFGAFGSGTADANRPVLFKDNNANKIVTNTNFQYNPSTNILTVGSITGSATKLGTANKGSTTKGIYLNAGAPAEMTYSLSSTVNAGTANQLAYYSGANAISATHDGTNTNDSLYFKTGTNAKSARQIILGIYGQTYGNDASTLISGTAGVLSYGDGGPQIDFNTSSSGSQAGALIFTDHDTAGAGASWHFVSNQGDWNVTSKRFHARTSISIGTDKPNTSYNLYVNGTTYITGATTITNSSFAPFKIIRSGSANASAIAFANSNGALGYIGMAASANGGLYRWNTDTNIAYRILDDAISPACKAIAQRCVYFGKSDESDPAGWKRILTVPANLTSGKGINDIKLFVRRHYNNNTPESFSVHIINNYTDTPAIHVLHAMQSSKLCTKIRITKSSDGKFNHVEIYYNATKRNQITIQYDVIMPYELSNTAYNSAVYPADLTEIPNISDTVTAQTTIDIPTNIAQGNLKLANSFWGMTIPSGIDDTWIRTTSQGIIPYQSGGAGSGHCQLGTDSWYFSKAYVDNIYGALTGNVTGNCSGTSSNVTGTVAIANGGTGATTRLGALKALTNEGVGTNAQYFLTITQDWGKGGYSSVANVKTVLGLKSAAYTESSDYVPITGGNVSGGIYYKSTKYDGSAANNGVSSGIEYPTTFNILDKSSRILVRLEGVINSTGAIGSNWYIRNYNTSGTLLTQKGISMSMEKDGTFTYTVSDGANFRSAIGAGTSSLTIGTTATTAAAGNHTHNYAGSSSAGGAATSANKINTDAGSATLPVYFSGGIPVVTTAPKSGAWFSSFTGAIGSSGVMEVGRYLDFHSTNAGTTDYDVRIDASSTSLLTITSNSGTPQLRLSGTLPRLRFTQTTSGKAYDNVLCGISAYPGNTAGVNLVIQSGGNAFIGGGESPASLYSRIITTDSNPYGTSSLEASEQMFITADNNIYFVSGAGSISATAYTDWTNLKTAVFDSDGYFRPSITDKGSIGTSSYKWKSVYATTFYGNLDGDVYDSNIVHKNNVSIKKCGQNEIYRSMINLIKPNKLAFFPTSNITIEYSTNGGSSWTDMGLSNEQKAKLFIMKNEGNVPVGPNTTAARTTSMQTRIVIKFSGGHTNVGYFDQVAIALGGTSDNVVCDIFSYDHTLGTDTLASNVPISRAVVGMTMINTLRTHGESTCQTLTLVFKYTAVSSNVTGIISDIQLFGEGLSVAENNNDQISNMTKYNHLYSWDYNQNATFPAKITATSFTGNVTGNCSGSSGSCTGNAATATKVTISRVAKDSKVFPGANKVVFEEYTNGTTYNLPSNHFYHIMSAQGSDTKYGTQLALGMTTTAAYYRSYNNQTWSAWKSIINSDTYDRNRYNASIKAGSSALVAANIIVGKDGVYKHLKSGGAFDITYPILYLNGAVDANGTTTNTYDIIHFTITTTQSLSLTAYKPVYIKGTLDGTIFTPVSTTPLTQAIATVGTTYDYIYLGQATSSTTVYLQERHPVYSYRNGKVREITPCASMAVSSDGFIAPMIKKLYDNPTTSTNYITISDINIDDYEFFIICVTDNPRTDWESEATQWIPARIGVHHFMINNGAAPSQGGGYIHCTDGAVYIFATGTNNKDLQFTLCRPAEAIKTNGSSVTTDNFPNTRIMRVYGVKAF